MTKSFFIIFCLVFVSTASYSYSDREREIYKNIKCLACDGQSVLGSEAEFAISMRAMIKSEIVEGKTNDEIYDFIRQSYGDEIFFEPPYQKATYILWFLPFIIIFIGLFLVVLSQKKYKPKSN